MYLFKNYQIVFLCGTKRLLLVSLQNRDLYLFIYYYYKEGANFTVKQFLHKSSLNGCVQCSFIMSLNYICSVLELL